METNGGATAIIEYGAPMLPFPRLKTLIPVEPSLAPPTPSIGTSTLAPYSSTTFTPLLKHLVTSPSTFSASDLELAFSHLASIDGASPAQVGAFLTALHLTHKDSDPETVAICAKVMASCATQVDLRKGVEAAGPVCDIVGTGGDGHNAFNVSTTAGIVVAGAGCQVHKVSSIRIELLLYGRTHPKV